MVKSTNMDEHHEETTIVAFLGTVIITGIVGNLFVVCIYGKNYKKNGSILHIMNFGCVHIFSCMVLVPLEMFRILAPMADHHILCNISPFCQSLVNVFCAFAVVCFGVERYIVTMQTQHRSNLRHTTHLLVISGIAAIATTWPRLFVVSNDMYSSNTTNISVVNCGLSFTSASTNVYSLLNQGAVGIIMAIVLLISIVTSMTIVCLCLKRRRCSPPESSYPVFQGSLRRKKFEQRLIARALESMRLETIEGYRITVHSRVLNIIFCVVVWVTVLAYLPFLYVQTMSYLKTGVDEMSMSLAKKTKLCWYSYYIIYIINPMIYFLIDSHFRRSCLRCIVRPCRRGATGYTLPLS